MGNYADKLKDPRWQKKRLQILERDNWSCKLCFDKDSTLHVHHINYIPNKDPWAYNDSWLVTLCEKCHEEEHGFWDVLEDLFCDLKTMFARKQLCVIFQALISERLTEAHEFFSDDNVISEKIVTCFDSDTYMGRIIDLINEYVETSVDYERIKKTNAEEPNDQAGILVQ